MRPLAIGVLAWVVLVGARAVSAEPPPGDVPSCEVSLSFSRVPDKVRTAVQSWLRDEPTCRATLEVSIEAVEGGYLVNARDARGRVRLRRVPDADTLGALIASWSADDRVGRTELRPPRGAPSVVPMSAAIDRAHGAAAATRRLVFSGVAGPELGVRTQFDLLGGTVPIGLAMAMQTDGSASNLQAVVYGGLELAIDERDRWHVRVQVGAGVRVNDPRITTDSIGAYGYDIATEASVTLSRELGGRWALSVGELLQLTLQTYQAGPRIEPQKPVPLAVLGLSCRL
jgi:hypothetical protein